MKIRFKYKGNDSSIDFDNKKTVKEFMEAVIDQEEEEYNSSAEEIRQIKESLQSSDCDCSFMFMGSKHKYNDIKDKTVEDAFQGNYVYINLNQKKLSPSAEEKTIAAPLKFSDVTGCLVFAGLVDNVVKGGGINPELIRLDIIRNPQYVRFDSPNPHHPASPLFPNININHIGNVDYSTHYFAGEGLCNTAIANKKKDNQSVKERYLNNLIWREDGLIIDKIVRLGEQGTQQSEFSGKDFIDFDPATAEAKEPRAITHTFHKNERKASLTCCDIPIKEQGFLHQYPWLWEKNFFQWFNENIYKPSEKPILFTCKSGVHRTNFWLLVSLLLDYREHCVGTDAAPLTSAIVTNTSYLTNFLRIHRYIMLDGAEIEAAQKWVRQFIAAEATFGNKKNRKEVLPFEKIKERVDFYLTHPNIREFTTIEGHLCQAKPVKSSLFSTISDSINTITTAASSFFSKVGQAFTTAKEPLPTPPMPQQIALTMEQQQLSFLESLLSSPQPFGDFMLTAPFILPSQSVQAFFPSSGGPAASASPVDLPPLPPSPK